MLCQLEMTASSNSIGSLAEELLEALKEDEGIADVVDRERRNLKAARRAAALASRQAILKETGLSLGKAKTETGESSKSIFGTELFDNVVDEVGPACVVCGDGFKSRPDEALGVYVLNLRAPLDCSITAVLASFKSSSNTVAVLGGRLLEEMQITREAVDREVVQEPLPRPSAIQQFRSSMLFMYPVIGKLHGQTEAQEEKNGKVQHCETRKQYATI